MPNKTTKPVKAKRPKMAWYEYITPFLGIKWGAEITLIGYVWILQRNMDGLRYAAIIVSAFLFLEWCQMAHCEFKRRQEALSDADK